MIYKNKHKLFLVYTNLLLNSARFSDTGTMMTLQRHCEARDPQNRA